MADRVIVLARHASHDEIGHVLSGRSDIALNARGQGEAAALAEAVAAHPPASLHVSPRARTVETAAAIGRRIGVPAHVAPALDEIDFGAFTGRSFVALERDAAWHRWNGERDIARCPGGETMSEAVARAAGYLTGLERANYPALCVTHCDIIRGLVAQARGDSFATIYAIDCDPASRTTLAIAADGAMRVLAVNQPPA